MNLFVNKEITLNYIFYEPIRNNSLEVMNRGLRLPKTILY